MPPQRSIHRNAAYVTAGHVGVLILLMFAPMVPGMFSKPSKPVTMIDFVVEVSGEKGEGGTPEPEPEPEPEAPPEPEPTPTPPAPPKPTPDAMPAPPKPKETPKETKKVDPPKPAEPKKKKPPIEVSKVKVQRKVGTANPLSKEEIQRRLNMGARAGSYNSAIPTEDQRSLGLIHEALYRAWAQPARDAVGGRSVEATLRLELDGRVVSRQLTRRSGIPAFDDSVQQALDRVDRIPGLSVAFVRDNRTVSIVFEVE